ncbi:hypothetical protein CWR48_06530 [Oceanobacillus arenosus]|uniref:Tryptophan-rich sensory protein n=1 Tax=Oceanobacillus arenosus TaxID=1229153 RepID=A0A3D8PW31_9BACI|nr:tryptophan-rich sensory protein [Oceanobacillus arenosus]RDW20336.1 hypothetical protein CWR48_06530 [Oceanobacillus arenosus]
MIFPAILVFIIVYLLFLISGFLFPIDRSWYAKLKKPIWTPSGKVIGVIWGVLYALIALSLAIVEYKIGLKNTSLTFITFWIINYLTNQAFGFFEFKAKRLDLAVLDTAIVALTSLLLIFVTLPYSVVGAVLLIPYVLWSTFATYLAWNIYLLNR